MPIGFQLFDENGLSIMMNEVQQEILGIDNSHNHVGKANVFTDPQIKQSTQLRYYKKAYQTGEIVKFEYEKEFSASNTRAKHKKGKRYFEVVLFSVKNEKNEIKGIISLTQEITNRKLSENILIDQNKRMEAYTFTLSHVIRRPVANLISLTNLFEDTNELNEEDQQTMNLIHESVKQLDEIIKGLSESITNINSNSYEYKNHSD